MSSKSLSFFNFRKFIKSFDYAFKGIMHLVKSEQNARFHVFATIMVILAGFIFRLNHYEWIAVCIVTGLVWVAEAFNTAIEKLVDLVSPGRLPQAGLIKDLAAGGVLLCSVVALVIALLIFIPKILTINSI